MTEQLWNFSGIHAQVAAARVHATAWHAQNEVTEGAMGKGIAAWQGDASDMWATEQRTLNQQSNDFQTAVNDYLNAVEEATHRTEQQEATNAASFG